MLIPRRQIGVASIYAYQAYNNSSMVSNAKRMWALAQSEATTLPSDKKSSWCLTGKQWLPSFLFSRN